MSRTFDERFVDADGFRIRYMESGAGRPLIALDSTGGLHLSRAHELLADRFRVIALEVPGSGSSEANERTRTCADLAATILDAARQLGIDRFNLWATSVGGSLALCMALGGPEAIEALVLEAPAAVVLAEMEGRLAEVRTPSLVVFGTRDARIPPHTGRVYREKMPNCHYVLVYDAGHEVGADRPEAFASLVADFLERREAFIVSQTSSLLHP